VNGSKTPLSGRLVGTYPASDLAVIEVSSPNTLTPAKFGDVVSLQLGGVVLGMGNPLGLKGSTSEGIVSAIGDGSPSPPATARLERRSPLSSRHRRRSIRATAEARW